MFSLIFHNWTSAVWELQLIPSTQETLQFSYNKMKISSDFYPYLVVLAILLKLGCTNSQENDLRYKNLCPTENQLRCNNNQILHIEKVSVRSNRQDCRSQQENPDCFRENSDEQEQTLKDRVKDRCQNETSCTINFQNISSIFNGTVFLCPASSPRAGNGSYHIYVGYTCDHISEFTISENDTRRRLIGAGATLHVLSPRYPDKMSSESQDITCVFTRSSQPVNVKSNVRVDVSELRLHGSAKTENLTVKSDVGSEFSIGDGPLTIKENYNEQIISVINNFTMHFNRCTTLPPGGKFNISFSVELDFEMMCTHTVTECQQTVVTPTPTTVPDEEHKPPKDDSNFNVIVGAAVAGSFIFILMLLVVILILCCKLRKKRRRENLPVEKREQRKQPPAGRFSSYGDRASNVYQEIGDNDPTVHYYSEIGHVNSLFEKAKSLDYDSRPAPEIPRINNRAPLDVVDELEPGYDKIKEDKEKAKNGDVAGYATAKMKGSNQIAEDVDDKEDSENSFSKLIDSQKPEIEDDYAKPDKENKSKRKVDNVDEGVDVGHPDVRRIGSEMMMEDNMDLYVSADETEGIVADIVLQNSNNNNNIVNKEENTSKA